MAFSSVPFLFAFFPAVFLLHTLMPSVRAKNWFLIAASLLFYAYGEPVYVFLMIACAFLNYGIARLFDGRGKRAKKTLLVAGLTVNLGMLGVFKYAGMLVETVNGLFGADFGVPQIRLPIGISFFTFQALSYMIDVYRGRVAAEKRFSKVLLYISFFPQLIAGPIIKYIDVAQQIDSRQVRLDRVVTGLRRFIVGMSKKVLISNTMGAAADYVFGLSGNELGIAAAWLGAVSYMLQIYFDFSGYSDMAIGLGRMFGFDFQENFHYPYSAVSMQDFWRRWHISLTSWFREYLYIPLGGNRKGKTRTWINRLIVFFFTGLWHGANWTFVLWGLYHGAFLILETNAPGMTRKMGIFRRVYVLLAVCIGFVIFRADSVGQAFVMLRAMFAGFGGGELAAASAAAVCNGLFAVTLAAAVVCAMPVKEWLMRAVAQKGLEQTAEGKASGEQVSGEPAAKGSALGKLVSAETAGFRRGISCAGSVFLLLLCMMSLAGGTYNPFIYFRF